jgi:predicted nucleic acid-binding protein
MLLLSDSFRSVAERATVYLDTNVFINAFEQDDLQDLLDDLTKNHETAFVTLSSVKYEFTRGARTIEELRMRREFIDNLIHRVMPIGSLIESNKNDAFSVVMSLILSKKNSQYTDYLLAVSLYTYSHIENQYILSTDIKAFPDSVFTICGVVTLNSRNSNGDIVHLHLVKLDLTKYANVLGGIRR